MRRATTELAATLLLDFERGKPIFFSQLRPLLPNHQIFDLWHGCYPELGYDHTSQLTTTLLFLAAGVSSKEIF